jgi:hypothetical protein
VQAAPAVRIEHRCAMQWEIFVLEHCGARKVDNGSRAHAID